MGPHHLSGSARVSAPPPCWRKPGRTMGRAREGCPRYPSCHHRGILCPRSTRTCRARTDRPGYCSCRDQSLSGDGRYNDSSFCKLETNIFTDSIVKIQYSIHTSTITASRYNTRVISNYPSYISQCVTSKSKRSFCGIMPCPVGTIVWISAMLWTISPASDIVDWPADVLVLCLGVIRWTTEGDI